KIIESGGVELQKLWLALQKAHQQNWHLAQANSHMLAELHLRKDRLKALRHELGCAAAALRAKKSRSEEEKKLHKHPENNIISIEVEERISKPIHLVPDESCPANHKKYRNMCKKHMLSSLSLGSSVSARKSNEKEKRNLKRRRSVTRRSGNVKVEQSDPAEDLFEIEDLRLPIRSMRVANVHEDNSGEMDHASSGSPVLDVVVNPVKKETREARCSTKKQIQGRSLCRRKYLSISK
ncbi:Shugoshin-1, partial [Ananas comosus]